MSIGNGLKIVISLAREKDIFPSYSILDQCRKELSKNGIQQWTEHYPTQDSIAADIRNAEGYIYSEKGMILAYMQICERQDPEYEEIDWEIETDRVLSVHRLAVSPQMQGKGIASKMMDYAETSARALNFDVIRLDAFSKNKLALDFYQKRNYYICGKTYFPYRKDFFYCFEKKL